MQDILASRNTWHAFVAIAAAAFCHPTLIHFRIFLSFFYPKFSVLELDFGEKRRQKGRREQNKFHFSDFLPRRRSKISSDTISVCRMQVYVQTLVNLSNSSLGMGQNSVRKS